MYIFHIKNIYEKNGALGHTSDFIAQCYVAYWSLTCISERANLCIFIWTMSVPLFSHMLDVRREARLAHGMTLGHTYILFSWKIFGRFENSLIYSFLSTFFSMLRFYRSFSILRVFPYSGYLKRYFTLLLFISPIVIYHFYGKRQEFLFSTQWKITHSDL